MRARLWRRQAASTPGASLLIMGIVLVAALLLTAWPRLAEQTFIDEAEHQIASAGTTQRAITGTFHQGPLGLAHEPHTIAAALDEITAGAGPHLGAALTQPRFSVTSESEFEVIPPGGRPDGTPEPYLQFRADQDITDYVEVTEGNVPEPLPPEHNAETWMAQGSAPEAVDVVMSRATAAAMGLAVGDEFDLVTGWEGPETSIRVAGIFDPLDPGDDQWQHQLSTVEPLGMVDPNASDTTHGVAYLHPDDAEWLGLLGGSEVQIWIPVEPAATDPGGLLADLRAITATEHVLEHEWADTEFALDSSLIGILQTAIERWQGTATVLSMIAAGPLGVVLAVLALATRLATARRRDTLALASARGGSPAQVRSALAVEGAVLGLPAAALGAALAIAMVPGPVQVAHLIGGLAVGLAPALFLATSPLPNLRTTRTDLRGRSTSPVRWALEVLVLGAAAAAVYLTLERGLVSDAGPDLLSIATPLLLAIAVTIIAVRVLPLPLTVLHRVLRRRRPLAGFLGSARSIREGHAPFVPVLALLVGISIAVFSTVMLTTLRTGTETAGLTQAGADVRISGPVLTDDTLNHIEALPGVSQVAAVTTVPNARLGPVGRGSQITLLATDTAALQAAQQNVPGALELPSPLDRLDDEGRLPILVSSSYEVTDQEKQLVTSAGVDAVVAGQAGSAPGLTSAGEWVLADLELLREQTGSALMPRLALIGLAEGAEDAAVVASVQEITDHAGVVTSPALNVQEFLASPSAASLQGGFAAALAITMVLSMAAILITLVLAAPARARLVAVLRTLGAGPRIARALVAWETLPLVVIAVVVGVPLGLALPQVLIGAVDLRPFTGAAEQPELVYQPLLITGVVAAVGAVLTVAVLIAAALAQRLSLTVLRIGDAP